MKQSDAGKQYEFNWYSRKASMNLGGVYMTQLGMVYCVPGYVIKPHEQWCHEISYFVSGKGQFIVDDKAMDIHPNEVFITPLGCRHSIVVSKDEPLHFCYLGFLFDDHYASGELMQLLAFFHDLPGIRADGDHELLLAFYRAIGELARGDRFSALLLTGYVQSVLIMCMRLFSGGAPQPRIDAQTATVSCEIVYSVMKAVDDNSMNVGSIADLADLLGYNPCYLSHYFKQKTGMTLQSYIIQKKIDHAIGLMQYSPLSITQIAEQMGFASLQSFSKAFKRVTGKSPSDYRPELAGGVFSI